jgi:hypothetical protein
MIEVFGLPGKLSAPLWLLLSWVLVAAAVTPVDRLRATGVRLAQCASEG